MNFLDNNSHNELINTSKSFKDKIKKIGNKEIIPCLICGSENYTPVRGHDIVKCNECAVVYLRERKNKEVMEHYYSEVYAVNNPSAASPVRLPKSIEIIDSDPEYIYAQRKWILDEISSRYINDLNNKKVIDIGCGWGGFLYNAKKKGLQVSGFEFNNPNVEFGNNILGLNIRQQQFIDAEDIMPESVDIIVMNHVLEHVPYPIEFIEKINNALKIDGIFFCMVPNFDSFLSDVLLDKWSWIEREDHYTHFSTNVFKELLPKYGFKIEEIFTSTGDYDENIPIAVLKQFYPEMSETNLHVILEELNKMDKGEQINLFARKIQHIDLENNKINTVQIIDKPIEEQRLCWCGGKLNDSIHELYGTCLSCGTFVQKKKYSEKEIEEYYSFSNYWHKVQIEQHSFPAIEERSNNDLKDRIPFWYNLVKKVNPNVNNLLEIGCAHGGFLYYCKENGIKNVVGIEVEKSTCDFAKQRFNLEHVYSGLFPNVELPFKKFEMIVGFDVIEHFDNPIAALDSVKNLLEDDGVFIFQTPCYRGEGKDWKCFSPMEHIHLFNEKNAKNLIEKADLELISIIPGYFEHDMFIIGKKKGIKKVEIDYSGLPKKKLLWTRSDSIGDNIIAAGMLKYIYNHYKEFDIYILCQEHIKEIYVNSPYIKEIIGYNRQELTKSQEYQVRLWNSLRLYQFDLLINSVYSRDLVSDYIALNIGAKETIASIGDNSNMSQEQRLEFNKYYNKLVNANPIKISEVKRHKEFINGLGIECSQISPEMWLSEEDKIFAENFYKANGLTKENTIVIFPSAQYAIRLYKYFPEILEHFKDYNLIVLGGKDAIEISDIICNQFKGNSFNLSGKLSLQKTASIISQSCLVISTESAGSHIANALGVKNIVLVGGGHFGRFMPYSNLTSIVCLPLECFSCNWNCPYPTSHCIDGLNPDLIADAAMDTINIDSPKARVYIQGQTFKNEFSKPNWQITDSISDLKDVDFIIIEDN